MQLSGMLHGERLLRFVNFPTPEVLGPEATEAEIKAMLDRHGMVFVKPIFKGAIGKKGKAGLVGKARDLKTALAERERLFFAQHTHGNVTAKSQGVTFEAAVPADHEVYFSIADSTRFRAPTITITHHGGVDIEELGKDEIGTLGTATRLVIGRRRRAGDAQAARRHRARRATATWRKEIPRCKHQG